MKAPAAAFLALALAACNSQGGGANNQMAAAGTPPPPPAAPAVATTLQPGRWEMTMRVVSLDMPNAPPEMVERLRAQPMPPPSVQANCVTPEEAADLAGNFRQELLRDQPNLSCQPGDQTFTNGQIRVAMNCRGMNGQPDTRLAVVGSFTAASVQAAVSADTSMPVGDGTSQAVRVESTLTGRRVGECNGTETG